MSASDASARTVKVSNLAQSTTKESATGAACLRAEADGASGLSAFIGFCGQIESLELEGGEASVIFAKESAAHTATLLNGGTLDGNALTIHSQATDTPSAETTAHEGDDIEQEHKPRSAIVAEMLAHGYTLSDTASQKAIDLDSKYGISTRFLSYFSRAQDTAKGLDEKHGVSTKAKEADTKYGLSSRAEQGRQIGMGYYSKGLSSPWGQKLASFYTSTSKQAKDIHEEAMRIKQSKSGQTPGAATGLSASSKDAGPVGSTANEPLEKDAPAEKTTL